MADDRITLRVDSAPAEEPVTLVEAKAHLRVDHALDDAYLPMLIAAARQKCEEYLRRSIVSTQWTQYFDTFPEDGGAIKLARAGVTSVDAVKYINTDGVEKTLDPAEYTFHVAEEPTLIAPAYGKSWPDIRSQPRAVSVQFKSGWGSAAVVPGGIKMAVLQLVGTWYANRESVVTGTIATEIPQTVEYLLSPWRVFEFM